MSKSDEDNKEEERINTNQAKLKPLPAEKLKQLQEIELKAIAKYQGNLDELESALGFLKMGFHFGWKPMAIIHSKKTFKKYEHILGIDAHETFPDETPSSMRNYGFALSVKLSNFWKIVNGEVSVKDKRIIGP